MTSIKTASAKWIGGRAFETHTGSGHHSIIEGGGENRGPSPMELVLVGLAGCTAIDVIEILQKKKIDVKEFQVRVEGTRADTTPAVYSCIDVIYTLRGKDIPARAVEQAIHRSEEKYLALVRCWAKRQRSIRGTKLSRNELLPQKFAETHRRNGSC